MSWRVRGYWLSGIGSLVRYIWGLLLHGDGRVVGTVATAALQSMVI